MRNSNIKLYNSNMELQSSLFNLKKLVTFEVTRIYEANLFYNLYISKTLRVLYFTALKGNKNVLIMKKKLKLKPLNKDKSFNEAFLFLTFLTKIFKFTIYELNFEVFKD